MSKGDVILFGRTQNAEQTPFDNTSNNFRSTDVQAAIEEAEVLQARINTHLNRVVVLADSKYIVEADREVRTVSVDQDAATIIQNELIVKSDGSTIVETASVLRVTAS